MRANLACHANFHLVFQQMAVCMVCAEVAGQPGADGFGICVHHAVRLLTRQGSVLLLWRTAVTAVHNWRYYMECPRTYRMTAGSRLDLVCRHARLIGA